MLLSLEVRQVCQSSLVTGPMHSAEKLVRSGKFELKASFLQLFTVVSNCVNLARPVKPETENSVNSENDASIKSIKNIQAANAEDQSDQSDQSEQSEQDRMDRMDRNRDEIDANEKELDEVWLQICDAS